TLGSTRDAAVSGVSRRTTRPPSSNGSRLYSSSSATSMPTAPIAMAPASERPPMIVSAGYFSSRRAPSFQSSHETAVRPAFIRSDPPVRTRRGMGSCASSRMEAFPRGSCGVFTWKVSMPADPEALLTLHYKAICVNARVRITSGRPMVLDSDAVAAQERQRVDSESEAVKGLHRRLHRSTGNDGLDRLKDSGELAPWWFPVIHSIDGNAKRGRLPI